MQKLTIIYTIVIVVLLSVIVFLGVKWLETSIKLKTQTQFAKIQQLNLKTVELLKIFVAQVLSNKKEITFEERLKLENAVLDLKDKEVLDQWHRFTDSSTDKEAQEEAANFLELLSNRIR